MLRLWFFCFGFRPTIKPSNAGFDFFQQLVVGGDLPVYFALVGADTALFHLAGGWPQMDRGNLINALPLVAAMVYQGGMTGGLQCPVGAGCPRCPPNLYISFIVPVGRILSVIFPTAFPIRDTLSVLVQVVCLAALCAPCAIFFQGPDGQHDMSMGVAGTLVMDGKVSAHSFVYKVVLHIGTHKGKLLFAGQFTGQGCFDLAGKLAVPCLLDLLHAVPEDRSVCKFRRRVGRQHDLRMDNAALPGVIVGQAVPFIRQLCPAAVGGCGNSGTALAALDDTDGDMTKIYGWHLLSVSGIQAPWSRTDGYMELPKYAKESKHSPDGQQIDKVKRQFLRMLKQNIGTHTLLFERLPILITGQADCNVEIADAVAEIKFFYDQILGQLESTFCKEVKKLFGSEQDDAMMEKKSLPSVVSEWAGQLDSTIRNQLFADGTDRMLQLFFADESLSEHALTLRLAKLATDLNLSDWDADTQAEALENVKRYKATAEGFHAEAETDAAEAVNGYQLTYEDETGRAVTKRFDKVETSSRGKLLYNMIETAITGMGQAVSEQEKRQILMDVLRELC